MGMAPIKHFQIKIDEELLEKFRYVAKYDDRGVCNMALVLIKRYVTLFEEKHGKIELPK